MRICVLLMRVPVSEEDHARIFGAVEKADGRDVSLFLLGDGVLCSRKGQSGYLSQGVKDALGRGAGVWVSGKDLRARGIVGSELEPCATVVDDLEGAFLDEAMDRAERVISW